MSKNVYLVSTYEDSNLYYNNNDKCFQASGLAKINTSLKENKFIYITNEEKIKDGEYGLCAGLVKEGYKSEQAVFRMDDEQREAMVDLGGQEKAQVLKVLLTNDPRLIADGVQEIEKSVLISFAENPVDYAEVETKSTEDIQKELNIYGHDIGLTENEFEDWLKSGGKYYSVNFPKKEPQLLTDLKDYFKNTSPEKIQSDWDETKVESPKGTLKELELLKEFEILEGVIPEQFEEKDWARFERFVKSRAEEELKTEKLYTEEDIKQAFIAGYDCRDNEPDGENAKWEAEQEYIENLRGK